MLIRGETEFLGSHFVKSEQRGLTFLFIKR
jgi:hypothetical protein